jgi:hypothetical protein
MHLLRRTATSRRAAALRVVAVALAVAAMVGQVGSYAHLAATRHVTCAEHGELVEAGSPSAVTPANRDQAESRYAAAEGGEAHGHEHCAITPHRRDRATHEHVRTAIVGGQSSFVARVVADRGPPRAIDLIRLAPKNSPPAA